MRYMFRYIGFCWGMLGYRGMCGHIGAFVAIEGEFRVSSGFWCLLGSIGLCWAILLEGENLLQLALL